VQPPLFEWTPARSGCRRPRVISFPRPPASTTAEWQTRRTFQALWDFASKGDLFWCRVLLAAGERYSEVKRKRNANGVRASYWRNVEQRRTAARADYQANRDKRHAYQVEYSKRNRDRLTAAAAKWREKNADRNLDNHLRRTYGLTLEEYRQLLIEQGGGCAICGARESRNCSAIKNDQAGRLHVDHDHHTDEVRGLLCGACNRGIGQLQHDPRLCRDAAAYLEKPIGVGHADLKEDAIEPWDVYAIELWDVSVA
jgi:hypothetical protein